MNGSFSERFKVVRGSAKPETAMSGMAAYPASGAFVDVTGYEFVHVIAHLGTVHASDTPVLTVKCSDAINGTLDVIDASLAHTVDVTNDDGKDLIWSIEVRKLPVRPSLPGAGHGRDADERHLHRCDVHPGERQPAGDAADDHGERGLSVVGVRLLRVCGPSQ